MDICTRRLLSLAQELASRGIQRRKELPQRRGPGAPPLPGGRGGGGGGGGDDQEQDCMDCQGFVRRGACRVFNERGRCSNHHPLDVHIVEIPRPRCPQVEKSILFALSGLTNQYLVLFSTFLKTYRTVGYQREWLLFCRHASLIVGGCVYSTTSG